MIALIIKDLQAMVPIISHNDLTFRIDHNSIGILHLALSIPFTSEFANELATLIEDLDSMIPRISHNDIAIAGINATCPRVIKL